LADDLQHVVFPIIPSAFEVVQHVMEFAYNLLIYANLCIVLLNSMREMLIDLFANYLFELPRNPGFPDQT